MSTDAHVSGAIIITGLSPDQADTLKSMVNTDDSDYRLVTVQPHQMFVGHDRAQHWFWTTTDTMTPISLIYSFQLYRLGERGIIDANNAPVDGVVSLALVVEEMIEANQPCGWSSFDEPFRDIAEFIRDINPASISHKRNSPPTGPHFFSGVMEFIPVDLDAELPPMQWTVDSTTGELCLDHGKQEITWHNEEKI